eukprot:6201726-Pleurochrysis_carterae.AAC.2
MRGEAWAALTFCAVVRACPDSDSVGLSRGTPQTSVQLVSVFPPVAPPRGCWSMAAQGTGAAGGGGSAARPQRPLTG